MAANPGLKPDMIVVQCGGAGNRLKEVRICFDKGGDFRACGRNENQARLCIAPSACTCHRYATGRATAAASPLSAPTALAIARTLRSSRTRSPVPGASAGCSLYGLAGSSGAITARAGAYQR